MNWDELDVQCLFQSKQRLQNYRLRVVPYFSSGVVERAKITPREKRSPFLAWGDFHARSRFARPTIPEEK